MVDPERDLDKRGYGTQCFADSDSRSRIKMCPFLRIQEVWRRPLWPTRDLLVNVANSKDMFRLPGAYRVLEENVGFTVNHT